MQTAYAFGHDYPSNPFDYEDNTETRFIIDSDQFHDLADNFGTLIADRWIEDAEIAKRDALFLSWLAGRPVEYQAWKFFDGEKTGDYETIKVEHAWKQ